MYKQPEADAIAHALDNAWETGNTIAPLSETAGLTSPEVAYQIQTRWTELRVARHGDKVIGRKIGLTSRAMQEQMGVDEPDYGTLWNSRYYPARAGRANLPCSTFVQPRAEGELAFLIGEPLRKHTVTAQDVLATTDAVAASIEIIDSRITDFRITLTDTIADNASYGGVTVGPWSSALRFADLRTIGMILHLNGESVATGVGADALGNPVRAVAWLATKLARLGYPLEPGDIVLSGSLCRSVPVTSGDIFTVQTHGLPPLSASFG
jgi:2-keto-4-pentenoate hydratase